MVLTNIGEKTIVRRRTGGLEITAAVDFSTVIVRRRTGGLEILSCKASSLLSVRRRTGGLEKRGNLAPH